MLRETSLVMRETPLMMREIPLMMRETSLTMCENSLMHERTSTGSTHHVASRDMSCTSIRSEWVA
jgi:hypothetical protein